MVRWEQGQFVVFVSDKGEEAFLAQYPGALVARENETVQVFNDRQEMLSWLQRVRVGEICSPGV